jgi:membrane protein YdbS with pleckstrin-like domain
VAGTSSPRRPSWGRDAAKYLLPGEIPVVATRRHPAVLVLPVVKALPVLAVGIWLLSVAGDSQPLAVIGAVVLLGGLGYLGLAVGEWWVRHFLITKRRVLLISGVLIRKVAIMPVRRITDMTWQETLFGQLLGYGTFRFESAGQDQALSTVTYLPHARDLYRAVSELLFGSDWSSGGGAEDEGEVAPPRPGGPPPPGDDGRRDTQPIPRVPPGRW